MLVKKHRAPDGRMILAVCDSELIGKKFTEGKHQLDLTGDFYKGEKTDEEQLKSLLRKAYSASFAGEKSVSAAVRLGFVDDDNIIRIKGVSYAIVLFSE